MQKGLRRSAHLHWKCGPGKCFCFRPWSLRTTILKPIEIIIAVDISYSMSDLFEGQTKLKTAMYIVRNILIGLDYSDKVEMTKLFNCIFILLSLENDQSPISSSLRSRQPPACRSKMGNPAFPTAQQLTCRLVFHAGPLVLSVKQGSCEYQIYRR